MSTYYGTPGAIASLPTPAAAVTITSSTDATPIVVTTATAHGLATGQAVIINDHTTNTNANGIRIAVVASSTTFALYTLAGAAVAGNGSGVGAAGTSQSLGLPGITLPEDAVTDIDAAAFNVPYEALADMTAYLAYVSFAAQQVLKGGSVLWKQGASVTSEAGVTITVQGKLTLDTGGLVQPEFRLDSGTMSLREAVFQGDADATLSIASGNQVIISTAPTAVRTLTLSPPGRGGLFWDFGLNYSANNPATKYFAIKRLGSAHQIVQLTGWNTLGAVDLGSAQCRIYSVTDGAGGWEWRLASGIGIVPGLDA